MRIGLTLCIQYIEYCLLILTQRIWEDGKVGGGGEGEWGGRGGGEERGWGEWVKNKQADGRGGGQRSLEAIMHQLY